MTLTTAEAVPELDMPNYLGQRSATFRFQLINAITGFNLGDLKPLRDTAPTLSHDTTRTIKRQVQGISFGVEDTALINTIQSRILIYMRVAGREWPLGRYMFADNTRALTTRGRISGAVLYDEMFIVDQQMENGYAPKILTDATTGSITAYTNTETSVLALLQGLPISVDIQPTPYYTIASWPAGTAKGSAIEQLSIDGDWLSPWFGNDQRMHFIRTFDPAKSVPTFDLDVGNRVLRNSIIETDDLITAPNRFIVISNGAMSAETASTPLVGTYDIPSSAPHSIQNRGFVVPQVEERQLDTAQQCQAAAENLGIRQTVFERTELVTPPDPRHDSYDVIRWQGENWLELGWSLPLVEGGAMTHILRKAYT